MAYQLLANGDVPDAAYFNNTLMRQTVVKCTSGTRPASPDEGMTVYETDTNQFKVYNGTSWVRTGAFDTETAGHGSNSDTTSLTGITSSTPSAGSPVCGTTFVAPPSGGVYITVTGRIIQTQNTGETLLSFQVRSGGSIGAGTIQVDWSSVRAIACGRAVNSGAVAVLGASHRHKLGAGSLTPGSTFNVQTMHWVNGGTGTVEYRSIMVEPVL